MKSLCLGGGGGHPLFRQWTGVSFLQANEKVLFLCSPLTIVEKTLGHGLFEISPQLNYRTCNYELFHLITQKIDLKL